MSERTSTRRDVLETTGALAAAGSMIATTGCLDRVSSVAGDEVDGGGSESDTDVGGDGSDSGNSIDGGVNVHGPAENVAAEPNLSKTEAGYSLDITLSNNSESPVNATGEIVWTDKNSDKVKVNGMGTYMTEPGGETVLEVDVQDPEGAIVRYSASIIATPA